MRKVVHNSEHKNLEELMNGEGIDFSNRIKNVFIAFKKIFTLMTSIKIHEMNYISKTKN